MLAKLEDVWRKDKKAIRFSVITTLNFVVCLFSGFSFLLGSVRRGFVGGVMD